MERKRKTLGVIGGMGPEATSYYYENVIAHTKASCDQEHIDMVILESRGYAGPNRSDYIRKQQAPD